MHATGDANGAVGVLDSYMDTLDKDCVEFQRNFESSELAMYKIACWQKPTPNSAVLLLAAAVMTMTTTTTTMDLGGFARHYVIWTRLTILSLTGLDGT